MKLEIVAIIIGGFKKKIISNVFEKLEDSMKDCL